MSDLHEYAFDVTVQTALRIKAADEEQARNKLADLLDCALTNFGEVDGETVVAEASQHGRASLYEVDGEPYHDQPTLLDAMIGELKDCVAEIDAFDKECAEKAHTDTGDAWVILHGMRRRMAILLGAAISQGY